MSNVYKIIELVGTSTESFSEAAKEAVERASKTVRHAGWFEIVSQRGLIKEGKVAEFQVMLKVGFKLED